VIFDLLAALALGYFIGSFPSARVIARLWKKDIFEVGSGNMGAMNTARNVGWAAGVLVLVLDIAKGALAAGAAPVLADMAGLPDEARVHMALAAGVGAVLGHAWSAYAGLRGGKALATTLGVSLPVYPLVGVYWALLLVALALITRRGALSAVIATVLYPVVALLALQRAQVEQELAFAVVTAVILISVIVLIKHLPRRGGAQAG